MGEEGKLYVGNLSYNTTEDGLREKFEEFGAVDDVIIITERGSERSKGFGFVTFREPGDASNAIEKLDQKEFDGREIKVNKAKERRNDSGGRSNYSGSSNSQDNRHGRKNDYDDN